VPQVRSVAARPRSFALPPLTLSLHGRMWLRGAGGGHGRHPLPLGVSNGHGGHPCSRCAISRSPQNAQKRALLVPGRSSQRSNDQGLSHW
jgi:hypothetical protein